MNSPHTQAFERWLLKCLINSTVQDVSRKLAVGKAAVEGTWRAGSAGRWTGTVSSVWTPWGLTRSRCAGA